MSNRPLCWACLELNAGEVLAGWFRWISARHRSWGKGVLKALGRRWIRVIGCRRTSHSFLWTQGWAFGSTQNRKNSVLVCVLVTQLCLTLWEPMDWDLPGSSVHGILQARILEWVAISFSRRSSWPRDRTHLGLLHCRQILYHLPPGKPTVWGERVINQITTGYFCSSPGCSHSTLLISLVIAIQSAQEFVLSNSPSGAGALRTLSKVLFHWKWTCKWPRQDLTR